MSSPESSTGAFDPRTHVPSPDELAGRVIAITGPTRGIGRAVALACARHGAEVVLIGRNVKKLEGVHAEIESAGGKGTIAMLDLERSNAKDYDAVADGVSERYGRLDGLLHNAGILGTLSPVEYYDVPTWCRVMQVNVTAQFALTQVLLPALKRSQDASIVFTSSSVGRSGRAYWGAYCASKFATEGLSQTLAAEVAEISAIRVNVLNPGATRTLMRRQAFPSENPDELVTPEEIVPAYLALLGPASRGVTGQSFDAQALRTSR